MSSEIGGSSVRRALIRAFGEAAHAIEADELPVIEIPAGRVLCEIGDEADCAWVLVSGRLAAFFLDETGTEIPGVGAGPGELIGESALLERGERAARLVATRPSRLIRLDQAWLTDLVARDGSTALTLVRTAIGRQNRPAPAPSTLIGLVPGSMAVLDEARHLAEAVAAVEPATVLIAEPRRDGERNPLDPDALRELEESGGRLILVAHPDEAGWTRTVAELADRLVILTDVTDGPAPGAAERRLTDSVPKTANARRTLVLVHPTDTEQPRNTAGWLDERLVDDHLHLRRHVDSDRNRVARHVAGRPLSVAIGSGGVRSAGGVGVIEALAAEGVAVDAVSGVSGGNVVAVLLAVRGTHERLAEAADVAMKDLLDYTIPVGSLISGKRAWERICGFAGDLDIADTWIPFATVTADLTDGRPVNHTRGPMADRIYASIAIPGAFPPVDLDAHLHVDGAVFDGLAVSAARLIAPEGPLVCVDLATPLGRPIQPLPRVMSGPRLLARRFLPWRERIDVPSPLTTLLRTTTVAAALRRSDSLARVDCHIPLNLSELGVLDFDRVHDAARLGAAQAKPHIDDLLRSDRAPVRDPDLVAELDRTHTNLAAVSDGPEQVTAETGGRLVALAGAVSLSWADLRQRARRSAVAIAATAVALTLLLVMTGVVNQFHREPRVTVETFGGDRWLLPAGLDGAFTSTVTFGEGDLPDVDADTGRVLLGRFALADLDGGDDVDAVLAGHRGLPNGAPRLADGRLSRGPDEIVLSGDAGYDVGDRVRVGPAEATVVGLVDETTVFAGMPLVFVPLERAQELLVQDRRLLSALVVDAGADVPPGLAAVEADAIAQDALGPVERSVSTLRLLQILLGIVAALIIGAVVYLSTVDRLREVAVLSAMGVSSKVVAFGVAVQALVMGLVAGLAAVALQIVVSPAFPLRVYVETGDRIVLVALAMVVAGAASYSAIRRALRVDPAEAFGGPGF